jgi:hypothetical protein
MSSRIRAAMALPSMIFSTLQHLPERKLNYTKRLCDCKGEETVY